jgi:tetratricopeptide (TPR) repeat protein
METINRTTDGMGLAILAHLFRRAGDGAEGLRAASTAVRVDPTLLEALITLGWALLMSGKPDESLQSFDRALSLSPDDVDARAGRGGALSAFGDHHAALEEFERAFRQAPGTRHQARGTRHAAQVRGTGTRH